jgi:hypothetical protein
MKEAMPLQIQLQKIPQINIQKDGDLRESNETETKESKETLKVMKIAFNELKNYKHIQEYNSDFSDTYSSKSEPFSRQKKINYLNVENKLNKYYFDINHKYSSALDVLASYLKGQKLIYIESKDYSEQQLNKLMMPSIFLSAAATVLSGTIMKYKWGYILISSVNAFIAFLLSLVNFFKFDAAVEAHKISAHQYDKLQSSVEFTSGIVLLFKDDNSFSKDEETNEKHICRENDRKNMENKLIFFQLSKK